MKIAVPLDGENFCEHFGGATQFMLVDQEGSMIDTVRSEILPSPEHKPGALPRWLAAHKVTDVVAFSMGERALTLLTSAGIKTYLAELPATPSELALSCLRGTLSHLDRNNTHCHGHHHDDEHHHHDHDHECHH